MYFPAIAVIYQIARCNQQVATNGLKYCYMKMRSGIREKEQA